MKNRLESLLLCLILIISLTACAGTSEPSAEDSGTDISGSSDRISESDDSSESSFRLYTDDCGRETEIPKTVKTIVASGPLSQIILYAIAPDMLVGLAAKWPDSAKGIISEEALSLPYFGQLYGSANLNAEELAKADPDLIIDVGEAKKSLIEDMDVLQSQTNIPSVHVEATLSTMADAFRKLGDILGREEKAEELALFCEKVYSRTTNIVQTVGESKKKVLCITGTEGLNVLAKGSYHAELIDMLSDNIAVVENPSSKGSGNEVSMEQILLWDPDLIVFSPDSIYKDVATSDTWDGMNAIRNGNYVEIPGVPHNWLGTPPACQQYLGLIWLPYVLYPDLCDYDIKSEITEYYRLFYGCTLTDEMYTEITKNSGVTPIADCQ